MPAAWPATLPKQFVRPGPRRQPGDGRLRNKPDAGPAIVRRRSSAVVDVMSGTMIMTGAQWDALQAFGKDELIGWTMPFEFPDPRGGDTPLLARFSDSLPTENDMSGGACSISIEFEVLP